jgi:hypothetical protein
MATIEPADVQRLLESDVDEPVLVLLGGKAQVVPDAARDDAEFRGALRIVSRGELQSMSGVEEASEPELERLAVVLSDVVDNLGG